MGAPMTMNRVIHTAVRRDLARLARALEVGPGLSVAQRAGLARAYAYLDDELHHHHEGEDLHLWPMLASAGVDRDLLEAMESEHEAMAAALEAMKARLADFVASGSAEDATAARAAAATLTEVTERHLRHEEDELEPQVRPHVGTPEFKEVEKKLRSRSLGSAGRFLAWIQDDLAPTERDWLRSTIPPPVLLLVGGLVGRGYRPIAAGWRVDQ